MDTKTTGNSSSRLPCSPREAPDTALVFIYASAGDNGDAAAYWNAREKAALAAQSLLAQGPKVAGNFQCVPKVIGGRPIQHCTDGVSVAYFMRSPDGILDGQGFPTNKCESLLKLRQCQQGKSCPMTTVDGSTTYQTWDDLRAGGHHSVGSAAVRACIGDASCA
jgi:hypothetical protein